MVCLNMGSQVRIPVYRSDETNVFGDAVYGVGPGLTRNELGAYGEKLLGSSSAYTQSNISRYLSNPQHYFQVNDGYVKNKLKGHWMRATEKLGGQLSFKPPIHDINAPDLYVPFMAFGTNLVLAGLFLGINGRFSPEALGVQLTNGLLCWLFQVLLLEATLHTLGDGDVPPLDVIAYGGYIFAAVSVILVARILCSVQILVSCGDSVGMLLHGNVACKDPEEDFDRGDEKLLRAFRQTPLSLASGRFCSSSITVLAWQCWCLLAMDHINHCGGCFNSITSANLFLMLLLNIFTHIKFAV